MLYACKNQSRSICLTIYIYLQSANDIYIFLCRLKHHIGMTLYYCLEACKMLRNTVFSRFYAIFLEI